MKKMLQVLQGNKSDTPPIWLMRQAGRYLPEYRAVRGEAGGFLPMCYTPDYAAEVTMQPIRRFDLDAAIIFSDILVIPHALGQDVGFVPGKGPQLGPLDIDALAFDLNHLDPVFEALRRVRLELSDDKTLIGFCGAPWTVACYMVEGQGSKTWDIVRRMAYEDRAKFQKLIDILVVSSAEYLCKQIEAGADVVQIFDSWSGALPEDEFEQWCIKPAAEIIRCVRLEHPDTPIIGFPRGAGAKYEDYIRNTGITAVGIDTSMPLSQAKALQKLCPVQGNLDPAVLLTGGEAMTTAAAKILDALSSGPFIFNLGHGVIKETPPEHVAELVSFLRSYR